MTKKNKIIFGVILGALLLISVGISGGLKMNEQTIENKQTAFLKAHDKEIKDYILSGLPSGMKNKVTEISIEPKTWKNIYDEGAGGFGATGKYEGTYVSFSATLDGKKGAGGKFALGLQDEKMPDGDGEKAKISMVNFFNQDNEDLFGKDTPLPQPKEIK